MKQWMVFIKGKVDPDINRGIVGYGTGSDGFLKKIRTLMHGDTCVIPSELMSLNGYPLVQSLGKALDEYRKAKEIANINGRLKLWLSRLLKSRERHLKACRRLLVKGRNSLQGYIPEAAEELQGALTLLEYYLTHRSWYPRGEYHFLLHIGRAVLIISNV